MGSVQVENVEIFGCYFLDNSSHYLLSGLKWSPLHHPKLCLRSLP